MKQGIKIGGLLLVLAVLLSVAGMAATHGHAAAAMPQSPGIVASNCVGAEVTTTNGTLCISPGTHRYISGVTQICNDYEYPVNFVGSTVFFVEPGDCHTLSPDNGTVYVDD